MSWQDVPLGAVPHAVMSALGVGSEPFYHEAGVGSAWWRGNRAGDFQKWLEGAPIDLFAPHRLEDTRLHALPSRFNPQNQHFDASLAKNAPINLFAPHRLEDTRLHGEPEGLGISIPRGSVRTLTPAQVAAEIPGGPYYLATPPAAISEVHPTETRTDLVHLPSGGSINVYRILSGTFAGWIGFQWMGATHFAKHPTATSFSPGAFHFNARLYGNPTGLAAAFVIATGNYASVGPAADALATRLNTGGGCSTSSISECVDFQTAWNAAGGTPSLVVDGLYGANAASALNDALLNGTNQPPQATPAACPYPTPGTPVPAPGVTPTPAPASTSTTNWTPWIIGGAVAAVAVGGLYMYKKKHGRMPRYA
jgi:hypothetical protein